MPRDTTETGRLAETIIRPRLLIDTARRAARTYRRARDLPGAIPGLIGQPEEKIIATLEGAERACEAARREGSPAWRPGRHVQILAALLAESATLS